VGRLIVISNRVSPPADAAAGQEGGLAMALAAALRQYSGIWFGWSGQTTPAFTGQISVKRAAGVTVALVDLEEQDLEEYYNGYANRTLWPLFHYRGDLAAYDRAFDAGYARVNRRFAETVAPLIEKDDIVWVHDYHLIPLAHELRSLGVTSRIGFFLHIPWPAPRIFETMPGHEKLVESLFDYDLIGFQTEDFRDAFSEYIVKSQNGRLHQGGRLEAFGRSLQVGAFPIGIDAAQFSAAASSPTARRTARRMRQSLGERRMIIGVDRLDYSKGLDERLLAYEQFLTDHAEFQETVSFLQIATPSRGEVIAYQDMRARLGALAGRVNGELAGYDWVPIRYVNRAYRRDELAGLYREADLALVTPLRDGMNLVAKEYVMAQNPADPGVLVLSAFAGASAQLTDALIVNPHSREEVAEAIHQGLEMSLEERRRRWERMAENVRRCDVTAWRDDFVQALKAAGDDPAPALLAS